MIKIEEKTQVIKKIGDYLVDIFHYFALFSIGATIVWSAVQEYLDMMRIGHARLDDILLLFIYIELGAMVGIYFKTHRLPVQYLIYITITGLSRHLVIDVQDVSDNYHMYLLLTISACIVLLSLAILILTYAEKKIDDEPQVVTKEDCAS